MPTAAVSVRIIDLPPLAGTRSRAVKLINDLPDDLDRVIVDCRNLIACTGSFVDELMYQILTVYKAKQLRIICLSDPEFRVFLDRQAAAHGLTERVIYG